MFLRGRGQLHDPGFAQVPPAAESAPKVFQAGAKAAQKSLHQKIEWGHEFPTQGGPRWRCRVQPHGGPYSGRFR
jgi:hypothetical protein